MRRTFAAWLTGFYSSLKIRKQIPIELKLQFVAYKDRLCIDRIQASAWLGFALTLCLFGLDAFRKSTDEWDKNEWYPVLFVFHLIGLLFLVPAVHITLHKKWIKETRLRRGLVIWGMVLLVVVFMLGQAVIVFISREGLVMFLGYIFIATWMFAMSNKERTIFAVFSFTVISVTIFFFGENITLTEKVTYIVEALFLSLIAFIFDAFDSNLKLTNFLNLGEIEREQERVKNLEAMKSRFFTNLTHEIRTPLTMISGMAREISEDPKRWAAEGSEMITRNAGNLLNLVNQILALSKIESGAMPVRMVQGDIVSYMGYVVDAFRGHALAKRIKLHYLCDEVEHIMDHDPEKFMTILSNLLSNAIKFTPEEGNVYVNLTFRKSDEDTLLELVVRDTGIGISQEEVDHIFERFYQAQNELTGSGIGTGIGLSLVHEYIRMLDGEIHVKSALGKGTTFMVTLPTRREAVMENKVLIKEDIKNNINFYLSPDHIERKFSASENNGDKPDILVIEDNLDVQKYLEYCLSEEFRVTCCRDGQSGIDRAVETVPDLILSDVLMPGKDGLAVCRELKQHSVTSHIPLVLLSAKVDPETRIAGLQSGADVYMVKPFEKQELLAQLRNLLDSRQKYHQRYNDPNLLLENSEDESINVEDAFVTRARAIVNEHLDDSEFNVTHFCRAIFLSRTQLHKKLTVLTGLSATHFVRKTRLYVAQKLLNNAELSIADIAYKTGFTDPNYFTRCYGEEFGESPSETRNRK